MGFWYRLLMSKPRKRRKPQSYREYKRARERRESNAARYAAEHPKPSYQATLRFPDGSERDCGHGHRTPEAAQRCGERLRAQQRQAEVAAMTPQEYADRIDPDGSARRAMELKRQREARDAEAELQRWKDEAGQ